MIDLTKEYQTRDGREVLELFHYPENDEPFRIIAIIREGDGEVITELYDGDGGFSIKPELIDDLDLIEAKQTKYVNLYI